MQSFRKILLVSRGGTDETDALKQALSLARNNNAHLTAIIVGPEVPGAMEPYKEKLAESLKQGLEQAIDGVCKSIKLDPNSVPVTVHVDWAGTPVVHIIQRVLREGYDLIVKQGEPSDNQRGFKAFDMHLLRKCPCPVWLCRPIARSRNEIYVGVAVDPESQEAAGRDLSLRLLTVARSLADTCSGKLAIISCWEFQHEGILRYNVWARVPDDELDRILEDAQATHREQLNDLIAQSGISGACHVHHLRGQPSEVIPARVEELDLDILVMGTVARTGIPGFFIGNTAENILQKIRCSLLALKPPGFVSPVKAY